MLAQEKIAVTLDNGELTIMSILTVGHGDKLPAMAQWVDRTEGWWCRKLTDAVILDELSRAFPEKDLDGEPRPQPVRFRRIRDAEVPPDRTYRGAWRDDGESIGHDIGQARKIHLDRIRRARLSRLDQLDRDWMRAVGRGDLDDANRIEADRQELRDLPATLDVDGCRTTDELKLKWSPLLG